MENSAQVLRGVTCGFCGLACDDLVLADSATGLAVKKNGCTISVAAFQELGRRDTQNSTPRVGGKPVTLAAAVHTAARILSRATAPLIAGFATDIAGARATLELADRIGAVVDHMNMSAKLRNLLTVQNSGWITTTLAEVKNRADFILLIGSGVVTRFPRFLERAVAPTDVMFVTDTAKRKVFLLGEFESLDLTLPAKISRLNCSHRSLALIIPALRALAHGQRLDGDQLAPSDLQILQDLVAAMRKATYGVIAWAAADFDFPHGELTIQTIAEMIKDLNKTTRFAGLPLGGSDGDFSSNGVQTWLTGLPLRSRYGKNGIDYDPHRYGADTLLAGDEVDALMWVSSFTAARPPPATEVPHIVLGPPSMRLEREPDVFIPVGTPGMHHGGLLVRADKVVVMRLAKLVEGHLPSVATISNAISERIVAGS